MEKDYIEATQITLGMTPCGSSLPELEVLMISTIVGCLRGEHKRWDELNLRLAAAATRLEREPDAVAAIQPAIEIWDEIRRDLWSHLQIEDGLILSWGRGHHITPDTAVDTLKIEHQKMRQVMAALSLLSLEADRELRKTGDRLSLAQALLALARILDSHVEHYESKVLPSILRGLFHRQMF